VDTDGRLSLTRGGCTGRLTVFIFSDGSRIFERGVMPDWTEQYQNNQRQTCSVIVLFPFFEVQGQMTLKRKGASHTIPPPDPSLRLEK